MASRYKGFDSATGCFLLVSGAWLLWAEVGLKGRLLNLGSEFPLFPPGGRLKSMFQSPREK